MTGLVVQLTFGCVIISSTSTCPIRHSYLISHGNVWDSCRSWRDLFLDKNAPPIVAVEREIEDGIGDREGGLADEEGLEEEEDGELEEVEREVQFALGF